MYSMVYGVQLGNFKSRYQASSLHGMGTSGLVRIDMVTYTRCIPNKVGGCTIDVA